MKVRVLGSAQDGGVPHLGYDTGQSKDAREDPTKQRYAASIKAYDEERGITYLFDAAPEIRFYISEDYIDGVFISHAELGTVTGLLYFGKESINATGVPVHCTEKVKAFLEDNYMFHLLMDRNNISVDTFEPDTTQELMGINVTPIPVVHEYVPTDTMAFMIHGENKDLLYMTDIDHWTATALENVKRADIALIDGTFWSEEEIDRFDRVPHPPIKESLEKLKDVDTQIVFTHMNHTNPVLDPDSKERKQVEDAGFTVAEEGMEFEL